MKVRLLNPLRGRFGALEPGAILEPNETMTAEVLQCFVNDGVAELLEPAPVETAEAPAVETATEPKPKRKRTTKKSTAKRGK